MQVIVRESAHAAHLAAVQQSHLTGRDLACEFAYLHRDDTEYIDASQRRRQTFD